MKIRHGFVSNSSSSSFIILGRYIDIDNVSFETIRTNDIYAVGDYLNDGQDIFKIDDDEKLAFLKVYYKSNNNQYFQFIDAYAVTNEDDCEIDLDEIPKVGKVNIISYDKDYNSSYDINDIKRRYDKNDIISKKDIANILRSSKIHKIEEENQNG